MNGRLTLALTVGMVAAVNPCGFAMLPAYLSSFLGLEAAERDATASLRRAAVVGAAVTAGFVAVFGVAGVLLGSAETALYEAAPWLTIVIGLALVGLGVAMLAGRQPALALPKPQLGDRGPGLRSMFLFGVSYAVASLSCTLPVFAVQVANAFDDDLLSGVAAYAAYAVGMGLVLMTLTLAVALARHSFVAWLRRSVRHVNRVAGALVVAAGAYIAWYGWYEIRIDRDLRGDPAIDRVTGWSSAVTDWVNQVGAVRLGLLLLLVDLLVVGLVLRHRSRTVQREPVTTERISSP